MKMENILVYILMAITIISIFTYIFYSEYQKKIKRLERTESIEVFGVKMPLQDYISLCNSCIAYLLCSPTKKVDMKMFINKDKLIGEWRSSMIMIRDTINIYPIIHCIWNGETGFEIDEAATLKKIELYQKSTQSDEYIIPMFDIGLIMRNPDLFSVSTKYQQARTASAILNLKVVNEFIDSDITLLEDNIEKIPEEDYKTPDYVEGPNHVIEIAPKEDMLVKKRNVSANIEYQ